MTSKKNKEDAKIDKIQEDHKKRRKELEASIRKQSIRNIPNLDVPASAHIIMNSAEWYQKFAKYSLFALFPVAIAATVVTVALAYMISKPPETLSYLMDTDGRVVQLLPVSSPSLTETEVLSWAATRIEALHNISFTDYKQHIHSLRTDFTPKAYLEYQHSLKASKAIEKITTDRLNMYIKPKTAPRIINSGVVNGEYTWIIEMTVTQFFAGGKFQSTGTDLISTIKIKRASRVRNLSGVVITKYLARETEAVLRERRKKKAEAELKAKNEAAKRGSV